MTMTSHTNGAKAAAVDPVLQRFLKMKNIHERHGLNNRKRRDCWTTEKKPFYGPTSSLASHLDEGNRNSSHLMNCIEGGDHAVVGDRGVHHSTSFATSGSPLDAEELEVSFSINLFPNGFTIGKANEILHDVPMNLCPYDRQAESIFCMTRE